MAAKRGKTNKSKIKTKRTKKYVYIFGKGKAEGNAKMKNLLGGKGANLAEMTNLNMPVPAGFTISTEVCTYYYDNNKTYPKSLKIDVEKAFMRRTLEPPMQPWAIFSMLLTLMNKHWLSLATLVIAG